MNGLSFMVIWFDCENWEVTEASKVKVSLVKFCIYFCLRINNLCDINLGAGLYGSRQLCKFLIFSRAFDILWIQMFFFFYYYYYFSKFFKIWNRYQFTTEKIVMFSFYSYYLKPMNILHELSKTKITKNNIIANGTK